MAVKYGSSSFSCVSTSLSSPFHPRRVFQLSVSRSSNNRYQDNVQLMRNTGVVEPYHAIHGILNAKRRFPMRQAILFATFEDQSPSNELDSDSSEQEEYHHNAEDIPPASITYFHSQGYGGKPGLISFYNRPYKRVEEELISSPPRNQNYLLWFFGPSILVASFIFPSLYLRRILSTVFEDSLLTDFLILFFTEALFYCGVAVFLLIIDRLRRSVDPISDTSSHSIPDAQLGHRIASGAALVLSLIMPMVTMGLVWPWTGPAASATLAPYLVGIVVQFAFEQYSRYIKSPSWPVIPIVFQVYRLHQLNRAAQLVTALSFTVRGAEMTTHNLAINSSLGTLLNVLQFLGVICIWSLSSFLMRFFPPPATMTHQ